LALTLDFGLAYIEGQNCNLVQLAALEHMHMH